LGIVIILNSLVLVLQSEYNGFLNDSSVGYGSRPSQDDWPKADVFFHVVEWFVGILFFIEVTGKIFVLKLKFFYKAWNYFDTIIVLAWIVGRVFHDIGEGTSSSFLENSTAMKVARLGRLFRLLRIARWVSMFGPLHLIVKAISSSIYVLMWSLVLIVTLMMTLAMAMTTSLSTYIQDTNNSYDSRLEIFEAWGTFSRATFTMFEITLANWGPPCWLLVNNVSELWALFIIGYKVTVGFAVVQVILSVFIQQTFKIASMDEDVMIHDREEAAKANILNLGHLFNELDLSGDGKVDRDEFEMVFSVDKVKLWFSSVGMDVREAGELFDLLDEGQGFVTQTEFMEGMKSLRGPAKNKDLFLVKRDMRKIQDMLQSLKASLEYIL